MSGSSNLEQWNPSQANQESDAQYSADALRSGGAPADSILPSDTFNKFAYQVSTALAALGGALANKGYTISDSSLANLTAVFQNIMTLSDMVPYAPLASPALTGSPTAPTPATGDSSTKLATTSFVAQSFATLAYVAAVYATLGYVRSTFAPLNSPSFSGNPKVPTASGGDDSTIAANTNWVRSLLSSEFAMSGSVPGAIQIGPSGLTLQWEFVSTPSTSYVAGSQFLVNYPQPFKNNSLAVFVSNSYNPQSADFTTWNATGANLNQAALVASSSGLRSCFLFAIGF